MSIWLGIEENIDDYWLQISVPRDDEFISRIKSIHPSNRDWDRERKLWKVKITHDKEAAERAVEIVESVFSVNVKTDIPDVPFGEVYLSDRGIVLDTEYDERFVKKIKEIHQSSRSYEDEDNMWIINPSSLGEVKIVEELISDDQLRMDIDEDVKVKLNQIESNLKTAKEKEKEMENLLEKTTLDDYSVPLPDENLELFDFQKYGVKMLNVRNKGLLADEMGLGKTVEVLVHLYNKKFRPVIIICPSSVKINWMREIKKWTEAQEDDIYILEGQDGDIVEGRDWYIVNYAILHHRLDELKKIDYDALVVDESHHIKNGDAKRTKSTLRLARKTPHIYALSGTPMPNKPKELWTQLQALQPAHPDFSYFWPNKDEGTEGFAKKYCGAFKSRFGWDLGGATNLEKLHKKLRKTIMIRRKKIDVLDELPEKRRIHMPVGISNSDEYEKALRDFREWMEEKDPGKLKWSNSKHFRKIEKLRQLTIDGKKENMFQWLDDFINASEKTVIFAYHRDLQKELYERYKEDSLHLSGGMKPEQRQDLIDRFREGDKKICVASLTAGGEAINLQVSSRAVFTELDWSPQTHAQAEDRIHRIGQDEQCDIYYLIGKDTIEEEIFERINRKQSIIDKTIDGVMDVSKRGMIMNVAREIIK